MKPFTLNRCALSFGIAAASLAGCGGSQPPMGAPGSPPQAPAHKLRSQTFTFTGAPQSFVVPHDVTSITVTADGASGATGSGMGGREVGAGGGGGGGGWFGGGGGGSGSTSTSGDGGGGGGGGGSSYIESSAKVLRNRQGAAPAGNGEIIISWKSQ
jgi:hypothetical protein